MEEFLDKNDLLNYLTIYSDNYYNYLQNNKVKFVNAPKLNDEKFFSTLAERIYKIRMH